jgi:hypothetical protein
VALIPLRVAAEKDGDTALVDLWSWLDGFSLSEVVYENDVIV